jgi:hypothetical protein
MQISEHQDILHLFFSGRKKKPGESGLSLGLTGVFQPQLQLPRHHPTDRQPAACPALALVLRQ